MATEIIFDKLLEYNDFKYLADNGVVISTPLLAILATYLLIVLKIGPSYMKSKPAYNLKSYIVVYNVLQVISCVYIMYKIAVIDLPTLHFWKCVEPAPGSHTEREFVWISNFVYFLKVSELSETVVFVLRKKQRQASFLHIFHHCSTLFLADQVTTLYKASSAFYPVFLNSGVHVFMYCYYLLAAVVPPSVVKKLTPVKKAITTIQIVQFALILLQVAIGLMCGCKVPTVILSIYVAIITAFFYMFFDFYRKNYSANKLKEKQS